MSDRRKKERFNETWTKDDLTDSLRKIDKKSHGSGQKSRRREDADEHSDRKERKRREGDDREKSRHKSHSRRDDFQERHESHDSERRREHRSRRHADDLDRMDSGREHNDRHKRRERDERKDRRKEREELEVNGYDRRDRRKDRQEEEGRSNRSEKRSSRHGNGDSHKYEDDDRHRSKRSSRAEAQDDKYYDKKKDRRRHHEEEVPSRDQKRNRDRRSKHEEEYDESRSRRDDDHRRHRSKYKDDELASKDKHRHRSKREDDSERHHSQYDEERHDRRSRHKEDEEEYRRRKKEEKRIAKQSEDPEHNRRKENDERHKKRSERHRTEFHEDELKEKSHKSKYSSVRDEESKENRKSGRNSNSTYAIDENTENKDAYNYDDEDFEDYDDDFEDDDVDNQENLMIVSRQGNKSVKSNSEDDKMDELIQAIAAETERANSAHSSGRFRSTTTSDRNETPFSQASSYSNDHDSGNNTTGPVTTINFSAATKSSTSSKTRKKILKRSKDLLSLIQLDSVSFDILDMAPVTEYNLYIKNFGTSNTTQASVQCNEDNLDQDVQTDIADTDIKWTQHPPHDLKCSGGDGNVTAVEHDENDRERMLSTLRGDSLRLTQFMTRSSKLIEAILNEDEMWRLSKNDGKHKSSLSFCDAVTSLQTNLAYLQGRSISHITSCQGAAHNLVAVAFKPASHSFSTRIDRKGLIAIWNTKKPAIPEKILVCDACPTCCCFGSNRPYLLFVGTDDGCILAYDLREPGVHHQVVSLERTRETVLRSATYSTGYLEDSHTSPIVAVMSVGAESASPEENQIFTETVDPKSHSGLAFQLASLEEASRLFIWIVVEMLPDAESAEDLGLSPYGRIKLIRSLNFDVPSPVKLTTPGVQSQTTSVRFSLVDPNNFFVGTDTGHIIHCTQYSASTEQSHLSANSRDVLYNEVDSISSVTSIDINPFQLVGASLILAGHEDGCLRLYLSDRKFPVINWLFSTEGAAIVKVQWSPVRPSVFFVLDSSHRLHVWDLAIMHAGPIKTEFSDKKHLKTFSLSNSTSASAPEISLAFMEGPDNSVVEVHQLAPHFSQVTDYQELDQLTFLVQSLL